MMVIPLQAIASQVVNVPLVSQATRLNIYQKRTGLYIDVSVGGVSIVSGVIAQNANRIVRDAYLGFIGDLAFYDTQGLEDPYYTGLGDSGARWFLAYLEVADLT